MPAKLQDICYCDTAELDAEIGRVYPVGRMTEVRADSFPHTLMGLVFVAIHTDGDRLGLADPVAVSLEATLIANGHDAERIGELVTKVEPALRGRVATCVLWTPGMTVPRPGILEFRVSSDRWPELGTLRLPVLPRPG